MQPKLSYKPESYDVYVYRFHVRNQCGDDDLADLAHI